MQALMLAAGMGKRLGKYAKDNTKCMIEVAGRKLIDRAVEALKYAGISKFIIVTGYKGKELREYITSNITGMEFVFVENNDYDKTNNIYSLYLASQYLEDDDTILLESDLIFQKNIIKKLIEDPHQDLAVVAKYEQWMDGTVVFLDEEDTITEFVEKKNFKYAKIDEYYKTVNIYKFSKEFSKKHYIPFLKAYIESYGNNEYYELVLKAIVHLSKLRLKGFKLSNELWYEIDDAQDLDIANSLFLEGEEKLAHMQNRYGGYWRFSKIKDFCYLVNPYFPSKDMNEKLKYNFNELIAQYPSGMYVQRINAARMFSIDDDEILVGNGAAELINSLESVLSGKILIPSPTFNEYIRCIRNAEFIQLNTSVTDFKIDKKLLFTQLDNADNVIIINPDNPAGSFITYEDMIEIIEKCNEKNKIIVVDESFVDFAAEEIRYTLITSEILNKYKNLIVVKSISKSYGVPGLRLGVIACGDKEKLCKMQKSMAVWNINSFAEYFLQIITLYQKDYFSACNKISNNRDVMIKELKAIKGIKVFDSQANYVMCELDKKDSKQLATELLCKYNIFIKDLSDKDGFSGGQYIRLAVRDVADNKLLIGAMNKLISGGDLS